MTQTAVTTAHTYAPGQNQLAHRCSSNSWSHNYASNQHTSTEDKDVSTDVGSQQHRDRTVHEEGLPDTFLWDWPLLLQPPTKQTGVEQGEEMVCDSSAQAHLSHQSHWAEVDCMVLSHTRTCIQDWNRNASAPSTETKRESKAK